MNAIIQNGRYSIRNLGKEIVLRTDHLAAKYIFSSEDDCRQAEMLAQQVALFTKESGRRFMNTGLTVQDLVQFEGEVAELYNAKKLKGRIHLHSGAEEYLINVFKEVAEDDWVMCYWRSHYHCLLKGVPKDELLAEIIEGRSISAQFPKYRVMSSAIVGGVVPIAMGAAYAIKRSGGTNHVHCFMGDMTSESGIVYESIKYARNFDLPITFYIEDNNNSINTETRTAWGSPQATFAEDGDKVKYHRCDLGRYPHGGAGQWVQF